MKCAICNKTISNSDVVCVVEGPGSLPIVSHLTHPGIRDRIESISQITTGALLRSLQWEEGAPADEVSDLMEKRYNELTAVQQMRLKVLSKER